MSASSGRRLLRYEGMPQPGSALAQYIVATNHGASAYHGLELQYKRRLSRGLAGLRGVHLVALDRQRLLRFRDLSGGPRRRRPRIVLLRRAPQFLRGHHLSVPRFGRTRAAGIFSDWETSAFLRAREPVSRSMC